MRRPVLLLVAAAALAAAAILAWPLLSPDSDDPTLDAAVSDASVSDASISESQASGSQALADAARTIEERRDFMKGLGEQLAVARNYAQEGAGSSADVAEAARTMAERAERIPGFFPEGTGMHEVEIETGARPAIWEDPDDFGAKATALREAALAFADLADGDPGREAVGAGMATFGQQGCGACHRVYREDIN